MTFLTQLVRGAFVGGLCVLLCRPGCRRQDVARDQDQAPAALNAPVMTSRAADVEYSPGGRAKIRITPKRRGQQTTLTFCYEDNDVYDPQIYHVRMARVDAARSVYEIRANGNAWLWKEWLIGTVPLGFRLVEGGTLPAGVYEIYVDAFVGDGELRVSVDENGNIKSRPWDEFDTRYSVTCPTGDRASPRIIPRPDSGTEGLLEKNGRAPGKAPTQHE